MSRLKFFFLTYGTAAVICLALGVCYNRTQQQKGADHAKIALAQEHLGQSLTALAHERVQTDTATARAVHADTIYRIQRVQLPPRVDTLHDTVTVEVKASFVKSCDLLELTCAEQRVQFAQERVADDTVHRAYEKLIQRQRDEIKHATSVARKIGPFLAGAGVAAGACVLKGG